MSDAEQEGTARRRFRRRWRVLLILLLVFAGVLTALWSQRRPIARGFVDRELRARGVPARYTVADIGLSTQRLTGVVIGDPRAPDLVADWIEVQTEVGIGGLRLRGVRAGKVRLRARLVDGRVSLGAIDRLMGPPTGAPFTLPALDTDLHDVRVRLETPQGLIGLKLSGDGGLDNGFSGRIAAVSRRLAAGGCVLGAVSAALRLRIVSARPTIEGPVRARAIGCGEVAARDAGGHVVATLGPVLDRWDGRVRLAVGNVSHPAARSGPVIGRATFGGTARATAGELTLRAVNARGSGVGSGSASLSGRYRVGAIGAEFAGRVMAEDVSVAAGGLQQYRLVAAGTPLAPLAGRAIGAAARAARSFRAEAVVEAVIRDGGAALRVGSLDLASASGAAIHVAGAPLRFGAVEVGGMASVTGGDLPAFRIALRQDGRGALIGTATMAPYAADGARLALAPVRFAAIDGRITRVSTTASLSGPVPGGRIDGVTLPIEARWSGTRLLLNPACADVAWRRIVVSGLTLAGNRLRACPDGSALLALDDGVASGGVRLGAVRLSGQIGSTPLRLEAESAKMGWSGGRFALTGVRTLIGQPGRTTRIDARELAGQLTDGGAAGTFAEGGGQIGTVPLILSRAAGGWRFGGGRLELDGGLTLADAAAERRFEPLVSDDVALSLTGSRIDASASLRLPSKSAKVADVRLTHDLGVGQGGATMTVPGLTFGEQFQPNELTSLTYGVVAAVKGVVTGDARIEWSPTVVTSTGSFGTDGLDLAAAFGPVTGIKTRIAFTDLIGLVSAPGQVAIVATVNPGIAVENGTVRFQLIGDNRVRVQGAEWPFAGGALVLEPTLLDFNADRERRMTFRVARADAAAFLQQFDFDNLNATGTFDGVLPMIFDSRGGRIEDGRLAARGGGSIAYVGAVTEKDVGFWGNLAFQALKALNYRSLDITLDGPLAGEMVTAIRFSGVSQGAGTKSNFIIRRLARLPFVFNVTVRAPFRQLVDAVRSYYDPSRLIERNLPALLQERRRREAAPPPAGSPPIQPPESEKRP
ncbi:Dicarboxylate transport [Sphingomonas guangdongensis]|uniref:Dicarboxylate transport n=1 Tax=Sphingomonas guangdongensis TaxID=1141890 RepID=A0A285QY77_9SPHN|nr:YdbH domain-containing protein [Sphingomonas guangdongensis]SOB86781.1 Dicarboxylate transport [Sphingomonas guangdongensis]